VETDIKDVGDVDSALAAYYAEQVKATAAQVGVSARAIRDWFDHHLITEQGIRGQVLQGPEQSQGLDNRVIWPLVDAHLVRAEKRRGATWFELAHDRLIKPVRDDNAAWRDDHLGMMQRQAALWRDENRHDDLLLDGPALDEARTWAEAHQEDLTDLDVEFLEESEKAGRLQAASRLRLMLVGAAVLLAIFAGLSALAGYNAWNAGRQEQAALAARDAAIAARHTADEAKGDALDARDAEIAARQTAEAIKDAETAARQTAEANYFWAVTSVAKAEAGLSEAAKFAALSLDRAGTIQVLEVTNQALSTRYFARPTTSFVTGTPTITPESGTQPATSSPISTTAPMATGTATPNLKATTAAELATALALQAELARVQKTQTAVARCPTEPQEEFADLWQAEEVRGRLGCPKSTLPAKGAFAEQPFERGYMYWAESPDLFIVTIGSETGTWYLFWPEERDWLMNADGTSCQPEVQPKEGQVQPVSGFGGLWCARKDIRGAIGFGTAKEYRVEGNLLQQFDRGWILRDSRGIVHVLFRDDGTYVQQNPGTDMVFVPGGQLLMGSPAGEGDDDEHPQHSVSVSGFWLDRFEVTNGDYQKCVAAQVCAAPHRQDGTDATRSATRTDYFGNARFAQFPVVFVSWKDARTYCQWMGKRLSTEAEWEWAAGGLKGYRYPWGDQDPSSSLANYGGQAGDTRKVGTYKPNALGLYDMAGNVWEWTSSLYLPYPYVVYDGREAEMASGKRVLRGGSWRDGPLALRTANRDAGIDPDFPLDNVGFRCARPAD
jgi:formylglycine-generating enzyme required for sulfatase activity